jgi:hypothetical protein
MYKLWELARFNPGNAAPPALVAMILLGIVRA